jgi:hypothetical protein
MWVRALAEDPDRGPFQTQLSEVCDLALLFFEELGPVIAVLRSASIAPHDLMWQFQELPPARAMASFLAWLKRCHRQR